MRRKIISTLAIALLGINGCGMKLDTSSVSNMINSGVDHGVKAGGHVLNAATLSEKDEDNLGQSVGVSLTNTYPVLQNDALTKYVTLVGLTVANTCPRPDIQYVFGILDTPEVNAFSGPNGYIFITRGALANMQDEAELAGVLGHEMSHVFLHHGLNQVRADEANAAVSEAVQGSPAAQWSAMADKGIDAITKKGYSQPQEYAADESSVRIIADAGYNPASYLHFLQRMAQLQTVDKGVMSTHPGAGDRVDRVTQQLQSIPSTGATLADRFKQNVKLQ